MTKEQYNEATFLLNRIKRCQQQLDNIEKQVAEVDNFNPSEDFVVYLSTACHPPEVSMKVSEYCELLKNITIRLHKEKSECEKQFEEIGYGHDTSIVSDAN